MINREKKPLVMGILNYTPDSFSDGGLYNTPRKALERALSLIGDGADIIDIGANSTRPGASILTENEELQRLGEVLPFLKGKLSVPVSVDTFYPECARLALENGAEIINDVSGSFNEKIARAAMDYNAYYVVTHNPCGADKKADYPEGVTAAVRNFFLEVIEKAAESGFPKDRLILDPGFGFGKSIEDNKELLENFEWLKFKDILLLCALSRKRFISALKPENEDVDSASARANAVAVSKGADIIRTHKV